jgi:anti-sigma regulatory factor (Ser/Thr protein kinase)
MERVPDEWMADDAALMTLELPSRPGAAGAARKALSALNGNLHLVSASTLSDLQLAVSELVTNAYRHGATGDGPVQMAVLATADVLRVEIRDMGQGFDPDAIQEPPITAGRGKGLKIVAALVDRWGVERADGTTVWFEVDRPRA